MLGGFVRWNNEGLWYDVLLEWIVGDEMNFKGKKMKPIVQTDY